MAFSNTYHDLGRVTDYASAVACYERAAKTPTGRARTEGSYGYSLVQGNAGSIRRVRKTSYGSIAFRLYATDVVTYHPDDTVTLRLYPSNTTGNFASGLTPAGLVVQRDGTCEYSPDGRDFRIIKFSQARFERVPDGGWRIVEGDLRTFKRPVTDRRAALAAYKACNLQAFMAWHAALLGHLGADKFFDIAVEHRNVQSLCEDLKAKRFREAMKFIGVRGVEPVWSNIRWQIATHFGAITLEDVVEFSSHDEYTRAQAAVRRCVLVAGW
jgi:hypothetical protein